MRINHSSFSTNSYYIQISNNTLFNLFSNQKTDLKIPRFYVRNSTVQPLQVSVTCIQNVDSARVSSTSCASQHRHRMTGKKEIHVSLVVTPLTSSIPFLFSVHMCNNSNNGSDTRSTSMVSKCTHLENGISGKSRCQTNPIVVVLF